MRLIRWWLDRDPASRDRGAHLDPVLRRHFESIGDDLVRIDVSRHAYGNPKKHLAALAWLAEKRLWGKITRRSMLLLSGIAAIAAIGAIVYEVQARKEDRIVRAWTVIAMSPDAKGNIGQKEALETLHRRDIQFPEVNLSEAYLRGVNLEGVNFAGATLDNAVLEDANLRGANLGGASLINVDLTGAVLVDSYLSGADLRCANLSGANLTGADISEAKFQNLFPGCDTQITKEQLATACVTADNQPTLPERLKDVHLDPCPVKGR